jgi:FtsH-binding integral membrane protein
MKTGETAHQKFIGILVLAAMVLLWNMVEFYRAKNAPESGSTGFGEFWTFAIFTGVCLIAAIVRTLVKD